MNLVNLLSKLQAIETGVKEEVAAVAPKQTKANEDIENVLRGLLAIQEGNQKVEEDDVEEGNEFAHKVSQLKAQGAKPGTKFKTSDGKEHVLEAACSECGKDPCTCDDHDHDEKKIDECGDMEMSPLTSPSAGIDMTPASAMPQMEPEMAAEPVEEKPQFTLTIRNGDSNLSMTTDTPDEIIHVMKLAGIPGKAEVKKAEPAGEEGKEKEVEEAAWGNTPAATNEKEPKAYGDIRDWGRDGTGKGKPGYGDRRAPGQGDNPMSESVMLEEYKRFKAGK